ncbi:MAG: sulfate ABC transporter substrate-binding protein [Iphinoe sp. HA4291-MV1]|jgi:sulfate transport system substrate-binding protein|nr:sulfate ABC transporter substrate-binding protein [Iphinoe sp. HA4291-MV1]
MNLFKAWQKSSKRVRTLLIATGLSVGAIAVVPVYAGMTLQNPPSRSKSELITQKPKTLELTLVSYAVTKEAYSKIIPLFVQKWKKERKQDITFRESYGGSGSQARAVIDGLEADVVALALGLDTNQIQKAGLISPGWEKEAPNNAIVTRSVVALVTRPGNPKQIRDWADLVKPGVSVITANPKTSGGARWNFLGLWGSVTQSGGNEAKAREYVSKVYKNTPVLPKDAREASDTFYKRNQGDVLLNYENEEILAKQKGESKNPVVIPQVNISIDNPVAVVDKVVDKRGTRQVAEAFVKFLYTPEAQREFAKVGFRPVDKTVANETQKQFPKIGKLYTVGNFGGWDAVQKKFFADGALFDQIQGGKF